MVKPGDLIDVPHCGGCNAGVCRVRKETIGPNAGRVLFMCTVKKVELLIEKRKSKILMKFIVFCYLIFWFCGPFWLCSIYLTAKYSNAEFFFS